MPASPRLRDRFHQMARFWPALRTEPCSGPALQVAGVLIMAAVDPDGSTLRVTVDPETAHRALLRPDGTVPLEIRLQDRTVYRA
ncbi:hypothetical protein ACFCZ5_34860 [Streptomyces microflavus]|uniref:hypothetical protein n=1 Tax=Streptomyces microflavus TaxID=1919 RepID=UPI0035DF452E